MRKGVNDIIHHGGIRHFYNILDRALDYIHNHMDIKLGDWIDTGVYMKEKNKIEIRLLGDFIGGEINTDTLKNLNCDLHLFSFKMPILYYIII